MTGSSGNPSSVSEPAAPGACSLRPGEVHLWLCDRPSAERLDLSVLSGEERARAERHQGIGPGEFAPGRALLRHLLSRYGPGAPADWRIVTGRHGKPALASPQEGLEFNLSHSGDWLAVVVSDGVAVGVDVQVFDRERAIDRLARRYFAAAEVAELDALAEEERHPHFYRLWALKEAWTKARGESLPGALGEIPFSLADGGLRSLVPQTTRESSITLLGLPGHALAVCGLAQGLNLSTRRWPGAAAEPPLEWRLSADPGLS